MRNWAKNLLLLLALVVVLSTLIRRFPQLEQGTDFVHFYAAARMIRAGDGRQLYNLELQEQFQIRHAGRMGTYFIHPPFEALLYLPFSLFPLTHAYLLWSLLNVALLMLAAYFLQSYLGVAWDWRVLSALFVAFTPVLLNFLQGQDSVLLMFLLVTALVAWKRKREFAAGCLLGLGLMKFHLILPLVVALLVGKKRKFGLGFLATGALLFVISIAISGWAVVQDYSQLLLRLDELPFAAIHPEQMANLRGMMALISTIPRPLAVTLVVIGSLLILGLTIRGSGIAGKGQFSDLAFANAVIAAPLLGYHLSPCDLSVLLLPMALMVHHLRNTRGVPGWLRGSLWITLAVMVLPPLHLYLLHRHQYAFAGLPILLLFAATFAEIRRVSRVD